LRKDSALLMNDTLLFVKKHKLLLFALGLAFCYRMFFFISMRPWDERNLHEKVIICDTIQYHTFASDILKNRAISCSDVWIDAVRTPGYPLFVAANYMIFGVRTWVVILVQILISLLTLYAIYVMGIRLFGTTTAGIAALLYAVEPHVAWVTNQFATDALYVAVFILSIMCFLCGIRNKESSVSFLLSGLLLGLATLIRPVSQFLPLIYIFVIFLFSGIKAVVKIRHASAVVVAFLLIVSPWLYRNYTRYGYPSLSSISGYNLLFFTALNTLYSRDNPYQQQLQATLESQAKNEKIYDPANPFAVSAAYKNVAMRIIRVRPLITVKNSLRTTVNLFLSIESAGFCSALNVSVPATPPFPEYLLYGNYHAFLRWYFASAGAGKILAGGLVFVYNTLVYVTCGIGMWIMLRRKNEFLLFFVLVIAYFAAITGFIGASYGRYKLPIIPLYVLLSAHGIHFLSGRNGGAGIKGQCRCQTCPDFPQKVES